MRENTRENEKIVFEKAFLRFRGCIPLGRTQKPYCAETVCFFCLKGVKLYYYYQVLYRDYKKASLRIPRNQPRYHRTSHLLFPNALHLFFRTRCHWLPPIVSRRLSRITLPTPSFWLQRCGRRCGLCTSTVGGFSWKGFQINPSKLHSGKLTWQWKILIFNSEIHLQKVHFPASHVSLLEGSGFGWWFGFFWNLPIKGLGFLIGTRKSQSTRGPKKHQAEGWSCDLWDLWIMKFQEWRNRLSKTLVLWLIVRSKWAKDCSPVCTTKWWNEQQRVEHLPIVSLPFNSCFTGFLCFQIVGVPRPSLLVVVPVASHLGRCGDRICWGDRQTLVGRVEVSDFLR